MAAGMQKVSIDVAGLQQYSRGFLATEKEAEDLTEPFETIGELLRLNVSDAFTSEGGTTHQGRWKPLNPDYERWKREQVGDKGILEFTGKMRAAAISRKAITVTPKRLTYEIDDPKAIHHQLGDGNLPDEPARRLVDLTMNQRRAWDREFAEWLNGIRHAPIGSA